MHVCVSAYVCVWVHMCVRACVYVCVWVYEGKCAGKHMDRCGVLINVTVFVLCAMCIVHTCIHFSISRHDCTWFLYKTVIIQLWFKKINELNSPYIFNTNPLFHTVSLLWYQCLALRQPYWLAGHSTLITNYAWLWLYFTKQSFPTPQENFSQDIINKELLNWTELNSIVQLRHALLWSFSQQSVQHISNSNITLSRKQMQHVMHFSITHNVLYHTTPHKLWPWSAKSMQHQLLEFEIFWKKWEFLFYTIILCLLVKIDMCKLTIS